MLETPSIPTMLTKNGDIIAEKNKDIQLITPELSEKLNSKILGQNHKPGLYVVATPIGNMFDISLRALWILKKARCIFAEDTRQSRKLLDWYGIKTKIIACHEYNETDFSVISHFDRDGIFALISDAGTPAISDPGYRLVNWCLANGIAVFPIPGASAAIAAMSVSGMPSDRFVFFGFPPSKEKARRDFLEGLRGEQGTLIFYESPNRLQNCLRDMLKIFGDRYCCICREITKIFEEFRRDTLSKSLKYFEDQKPTGEFVILLSGYGENEEENGRDLESILEEIEMELDELLKEKSLKESAKILSEKYGKYGVGRNKIYKMGLELNKLREI